jgi:hypothetical protein
LLLPEHIQSDSGLSFGGVHTLKGFWRDRSGGLLGTYRVGETFEIEVDIEGYDQYIGVKISVENLTQGNLTGIRVLICSSVNHLPGSPDWSNRLFIPAEVPLDRDAQGRFWYQHLTPGRLMALRPGGWMVTHPSPGNPDPDLVPRYSFVPSITGDTIAYGAQSLDGKSLLFQSWNHPGEHETPCPGNACMHLDVPVSECLEPGEKAGIEGLCGLYSGTWTGLRSFIGKLL